MKYEYPTPVQMRNRFALSLVVTLLVWFAFK